MSDHLQGTVFDRGGLTISVRDNVAVTHVAARRGMRSGLEARVSATLGMSLPSTPRMVEAAGKMIVWAGPEQWFVIEPQTPATDPSADLAKAFKGAASVVDVSDNRMIFRVTGASAAKQLGRSMAIDFHDRNFKPGDVAITHAAHHGVTVWRLSDGEGYVFACARTYAADFLNWLCNACTNERIST